MPKKHRAGARQKKKLRRKRKHKRKVGRYNK